MKTAHRSIAERNNNWLAQRLEMLGRTINPVRNRLRQQAGNFNEPTRSLARPVPYHLSPVELFGQSQLGDEGLPFLLYFCSKGYGFRFTPCQYFFGSEIRATEKCR